MLQCVVLCSGMTHDDLVCGMLFRCVLSCSDIWRHTWEFHFKLQSGMSFPGVCCHAQVCGVMIRCVVSFSGVWCHYQVCGVMLRCVVS